MILLCPAAGDYGNKMFLFSRTSFYSDMFSCWMYWRQLSAWASESMKQCPVLCVVLKQPGGRRCNSEAAFFERLVYLNINRFCKPIVVVAVPVCSPVRIACFYLVSVQFNPLPFLERAGPARKKKGVRGNLVKGLIAPHSLG